MIICDIETIAADGIEAEPVSAPANYKDPEKIAAYIAEAEKAQRDKAALYPWTARVIAIGYQWAGSQVVEVLTCRTETTEACMLDDFWRVVRDAGNVVPLIGYNHRAFDLPVLMARSALLGVPYPTLNVDRYRSPHPDLMQLLTWNGAIQARSLKWFAKRFGLNTDDAFSGAEIATLWEDQNWDAIKKHVESDVTLTRQLAERLGVIKAPVRVAA
jgi:predicted PolB exonuclease-like 3'-5' exonuclease